MSLDDSYSRYRLKTLPQVLDRARMHDEFVRLLPRWFDAPRALSCVDVEILSKRKRRGVLRYRLAFDDAPAFVLIGKVFKADRGVRVEHVMQQLWSHDFHDASADRVSVPRVFAYLPELSLLLQEEVGGAAAEDALREPHAESVLRRAGAAAAKLHRTPVHVSEPYTLADHLRRCRPAPQVLCERLPDLRASVETILAESARLMQAYARVEPVLIHGDLHLGQVYVSEARTWLIDFDATCNADPATDIANLLVALERWEGRGPDTEVLAAAFLDEYLKSMPPAVLSRVPLFEAIAHLRRACKHVRLATGREGRDDWRERVRRHLERGLECIAAAHERSPDGSSDGLPN